MPDVAHDTLTAREADFVAGMVAGMDKGEAAVHAGYSEKTASSQATRLLKKVKIKDAIAAGRLRIAQRQSMEGADVISEWAKIAMADPNELVSLVRGACRYCHGIDHAYQWRTPDEFATHLSAWHALPEKKQAVITPPSEAGGFGYRFRADPKDDCPACEGEGIARTVLRDTRNLGPNARALYAGVKKTQHGIEVKMRDQDGALTNLARVLGLFAEDNRRPLDVSDPIKEILEGIWKQGSRAPIATQKETET